MTGVQTCALPISGLSQASYDPLNDFTPISLAPINPFVIVTRADHPANSILEMQGFLSLNPDRGRVGVPPGSPELTSAVYLQSFLNSRLTFVSLGGFNADEAAAQLKDGKVDFIIGQAGPWSNKPGTKILAVIASQRLKGLPHIPTVDEAGLPGFYSANWRGVWAPRNTSPDIVQRLDAAIVSALSDQSLVADMRLQEVPTTEQLTPELLKEFHETEIVKWGPILNEQKSIQLRQ